MKIPIYVVTGFLEAGKTTFLNQLLYLERWKNTPVLLLQFEEGEEDFAVEHTNCNNIVISRAQLEEPPAEIAKSIQTWIVQQKPQEIWIEWNGMEPFYKLYEIFLDESLRSICRIRKVIHIAQAQSLLRFLGQTGAALPEQIANSDFVIARGMESASEGRRLRRTLRTLNPGIKLYDTIAHRSIMRRLDTKHVPILTILLFMVLLAGLLQVTILPFLQSIQFSINTWINVFLGVTLQAIPFLLIGVLLSSAIQILLPQDFLENHFPKSVGMGIVTAVLAGFCLPVCDCASIPLFRGFVKKGVPLCSAVTFMTVAPVVNPVVMLSTYYAFGGSVKMVAYRVSFGIIAAVLIGLTFALRAPREDIISGQISENFLCSCGCTTTSEAANTRRERITLFLRHAQAEFFQVGKFLLVGTAVSACFQMISTPLFGGLQGGSGRAAAILTMMLMAFAFSLCSTADAVIARSLLGQFPLGSVFGFLVFGPMIDIKNVLMLSSAFSKRFILRLSITAFVICFAVVFVFTNLGGM